MTQSYTPSQIADGILAGEITRDSAFVPLAEVEDLRDETGRLQSNNDNLTLECGEARAEIERLKARPAEAEIGRLDVMWQALVRERDCALVEVEKLRAALMEISQYETSAPAGFEWDIIVEELVALARKTLEATP